MGIIQRGERCKGLGTVREVPGTEKELSTLAIITILISLVFF